MPAKSACSSTAGRPAQGASAVSRPARKMTETRVGSPSSARSTRCLSSSMGEALGEPGG